MGEQVWVEGMGVEVRAEGMSVQVWAEGRRLDRGREAASRITGQIMIAEYVLITDMIQ